jgi:hypothetical protein
MKSLLYSSLVLAASVAGAQTVTQGQIRHIETSLNHLTVLDFGEPVTTLAVADSESFQVEQHGDKVLIKPVRDGVSTNLFVWTASRQFSYELDAAGQLASMDVLVSEAPGATKKVAAEPSDAEIQKVASLVLTQTMMGAENITRDFEKRRDDRVEINLEQVYRAKDRIYIRYTAVNQSDAPFRLTSPGVHRASLPEHTISLLSLRDHQITPQAYSAFKVSSGPALEVLEAESAARDLASGQKTTGVISFAAAQDGTPRLYQLNFGSDQNQSLTVAAVL